MANIGFDAKRAFNNRSGLGNYSRNTIRLLLKYYPEHSYHLYTPKSSIDFLSENDNVRVVTPESFTAKKLHSLWRSYSLAGKIKKDKLSLYHGLSHELPVGIEKTGVKSIVTIHDLIFMRYPELYKPFDRKVYQKKFKYAAENSDLVVAISEQTKEDVIEFLKIKEDKIRVVYQGCDERFRQNMEKEVLDQIISKHSLPDEYLLYVGTIEPRKNLLQIVKAMHLESIQMPLVVVGRPTSYINEVKAFIQQHQMTNVIFLQGISNEELPGIYQRAKAFIYPSIFEGFGIPILEALCSGLPVITTKYGCFPEAGGPDSLYINPEDPQELAESIQLLLNDNDRCLRMKESGLEYSTGFSDQIITDNLMSIYRELI